MIEPVYETLAQTIDAIGPEKTDLFLSKLALLLAHDLNDPDRVIALIQEATQHLDPN